MAETQKKPGRPKKTDEEKLDEELEILDPVNKAVERKLVHPETGEERTFVQHELAFIPKTRFFRLFAGTVRVAAQQEAGGVGLFINDLIASFQSEEGVSSVDFLDTLLKLVELVPDFIDEAFVLMLNVKPEDQAWAMEVLESIDDETAMDIIDVFIAQNAKAVRNFFTKHIQKASKRFSQEIVEPIQDQEE